jgi:hypothetical protein
LGLLGKNNRQGSFDIRKKIRERRRDNDLKQYLAKVREQIPVWTIYDSVAERPDAMRR